uniref:P2X purinoceptor n=1 Tax=Denticeps clupeoides TaxID=299321 RepID=A0AAY4DXH7_9TELE
VPCRPLNLCEYETSKLVRIKSVKLGSLKWALNGVILLVICIMLLWNKEYQEYDLVVSSVTTKVKGVAQTNTADFGEVVWDVVDYSPNEEKNSFFVATNFIVTKKQKQGKCPEVPHYGTLCRTDNDCKKGLWDIRSHGITGVCVKFDVTTKTCEVSAWCPIENTKKPPRPALLTSAENFTVLIKNNIRFPAFNFIRRNILPEVDGNYLKKCIYNQRTDPYCPIFRLGDVVQGARENFADIAVEGGVIGIQINWDCDLNRFFNSCLPKYSFRRLDEKESNRTLYPGLNFRFARYYTENGVESRTLYKAFGIRFDVMVFGKAGKFSIVQLIIYIGSTLSYYALTTVFIDWLIGTSCYSKESQQVYSERKYESVQDRQECLVGVSFVDENQIRVVKQSKKKSLQEVKPLSLHPQSQNRSGKNRCKADLDLEKGQTEPLREEPKTSSPSWCQCGCCRPSGSPHEQLCCRCGRGRCLTSSVLFPKLVLNRSVLQTALLYRDPLAELHEEAQLRHWAYAQYISWRFGDTTPRDAIPVIPSCCVWQIRDEYPSQDGKYSGLRLNGGQVS